MGFQCGIVGLPNVGKSTIFNALTAAGAAAANYPFCTIEPNLGIVALRDERLDKLAAVFAPEKVIPTSVEFVDIAGLVKGASKGEGLGNQFLGHIRSVDAIAHVVRCFDDPDVVHVHGGVNPIRDIEVIDTELALADLDGVQKAIAKVEKKAKAGDAESSKLLEIYRRLEKALNEGRPVRGMGLTPEDNQSIRDLFLLTNKPMLYVANVAEGDLHTSPPSVEALKAHARKEGAEVVVLSGKIESEIAELSQDERAAFLKDLGLKESGLDQLARVGYKLLGLITYFTAGKKEVRAWTVPAGSKAPEAAGVIHSDFQKGFIRAECYHYDDLVALGSEAKVKEAGKMRLEGRDYAVKDGDILFFRFNI